jgi:hypothetical protein
MLADRIGQYGTYPFQLVFSEPCNLDDGALGASLDSLDEIPLRHARDLVGQARPIPSHQICEALLA